MVNDFTPDFFHITMLQDVIKLSKENEQGITYYQLYKNVVTLRKEKYNLPTPKSSFSRKLGELIDNHYLEVVRSHPRTLIRLKTPEVQLLVDAYLEMRKFSQKEKIKKINGDVQKEYKK